ncbi:MAG: hypothetical protein AAFN70_12215 [Planctomycetota bacterium]
MIPISLCAAALALALALVGLMLAWYTTAQSNENDIGFAKITNTADLACELVDGGPRRLHIASG